MRLGLFHKIAFSYWKIHKSRLFSVLLILILGTAALCCGSLFIRSEKCSELEMYYNWFGNYDLKINSVSQSVFDKLSALDDFEVSGKYFEIGMARGRYSSAEHLCVAFPDKTSQDLYALTCTKGRYPEKENEIALDVSTAYMLGIVPEPGRKAVLSIMSDDGKQLASDAEFIITGIFQQSDDDVVGGWERAASNPELLEDYRPPEIIISRKFLKGLDTSTMNVTGFFQRKLNEESDSRDDEKKTNISSSMVVSDMNSDMASKLPMNITKALGTDYEEFKKIDFTESRTLVYENILGMQYTFGKNGTSINHESMLKAIRQGKSKKDFYSHVLIPLLYIFVFIISLISIFNIVKNVVKDYSDDMGIMRSLGLESGLTLLLVFITFVIVIIPGIILGLAAGSGAYLLILDVLNKYYDFGLKPAFNVPALVRLVTFDPFIIPALAILICSLVSLISPSRSIIRKTPVLLMNSSALQSDYSGVRKKKSAVKVYNKLGRSEVVLTGNWMRLLRNRMSLGDISSIVIITLVASTAVFGYSYFRIYSASKVEENYDVSAEKLSKEYDYIAQRPDNWNMLFFHVENHHDYGVPIEKAEKIASNGRIKEVREYILNNSTRVAYVSPVSSEKEKLLSHNSLNPVRPDDTDKNSEFYELKKADYKAEMAAIKGTGYDPDSEIYSLQTKGLPDAEIEGLEKYVKAGSINLKKIKSGQEVILAVPKKLEDIALAAFKPGEELPLSDVVLNDQEEGYDPSSFDGRDYGLHEAYKKM
ncbi:MAG: ABC transporter permease [Lachnospiraceae bacterium]|nr:ABC transporter permease [Lachnospiraceae bacterium]